MQGEDDQLANNQGYFDQDDDVDAPMNSGESVDWRASEYIHHDKGALWMTTLIAVAVVIIGVSLWLGQWLFAGLAVLMAITFGVYAFRKPRDVQYHLADDGLRINEKTYVLDDFKAFGVVAEGAFYSALLIPTKRFMPSITIYFSETEGDQIVDILGAHLPMQPITLDWFDAFMRKLRF